MLKCHHHKDASSFRFSHLKNLSMLKLLSDLERFLKCFSHLKNLSMLKSLFEWNFSTIRFSHLKNLSMLK